VRVKEHTPVQPHFALTILFPIIEVIDMDLTNETITRLFFEQMKNVTLRNNRSLRNNRRW
jgi:hypothetical protein